MSSFLCALCALLWQKISELREIVAQASCLRVEGTFLSRVSNSCCCRSSPQTGGYTRLAGAVFWCTAKAEAASTRRQHVCATVKPRLRSELKSKSVLSVPSVAQKSKTKHGTPSCSREARASGVWFSASRRKPRLRGEYLQPWQFFCPLLAFATRRPAAEWLHPDMAG
jgi:hypothetical protein